MVCGSGIRGNNLKFELGKFPEQKYLKAYWDANYEATLEFIEQIMIGVHGQIVDGQGVPVEGAEVGLFSFAPYVQFRSGN